MRDSIAIQMLQTIGPLPKQSSRPDTTLVSDFDSIMSLPPVTLTRGDSIALGKAEALIPFQEEPKPAWTEGIDGLPTTLRPGNDSSLLMIIAVIFVLVVLSFRYCKNMISTFTHELIETRQRANLFEEHTTNENSVVALLAVQLSVCIGLLLYSLLWIQGAVTQPYSFGVILRLMALYAAYYVFRYIAYNVVGYTFTSRTNKRIWVQGFTASQSLLSLTITFPALAAIFFPETASTMLLIAGLLYFLAEIVFIIKGFRIFYNKFYSLLYFILYLCTLEIIPVIFIYTTAILIS